MTINRVGPTSCAKIAGVLYAAMGLLLGCLFSLLALVGAALPGTQMGVGQSAIIGTALGIGAVTIFPIFYGAIGFIFAWIGAWLYNLIAARVGGMEIDIA